VIASLPVSHEIVETVVKYLVPLYTVKPELLHTFWHRGALCIEPDAADYRLIIGRHGRNLEALRCVASFAARPATATIEVIEPDRPSEKLPEKALVKNDDRKAAGDSWLQVYLASLLFAMDVKATYDEPASPEEFTTVLSARTSTPIDAITRRSISILFGAIGRMNGRNVRVHISHE